MVAIEGKRSVPEGAQEPFSGYKERTKAEQDVINGLQVIIRTSGLDYARNFASGAVLYAHVALESNLLKCPNGHEYVKGNYPENQGVIESSCPECKAITRLCPKCKGAIKRKSELAKVTRVMSEEVGQVTIWLECPCGYSNESLDGF